MRERWGRLVATLAVAAALLAPQALAASPQRLTGLEMAVTYAHGALQVYEIAQGTPGATLALPVAAGAEGLVVTGGAYSLTAPGATGRSALVRSGKGQASVRYLIKTPTDRDFLLAWQSPEPIGRVLMLTGPQVHPSGLGMAPFTLGGRVEVGGQTLVSFNAHDLPAGFRERWLLELGQPGGWLANIFLGLDLALPLLFIAVALRSVFRRRARMAA